MSTPAPSPFGLFLARLRGILRYWYLSGVGVLGDRLPVIYEWDARRQADRLLTHLAAERRAGSDPTGLEVFESSEHSQNGEDGVIGEILHRIGEGGRFFVEIGASDGEENCTRALADLGWDGIWVEADPAKAKQAKAVAPQVTVIDRPAFRDDVAGLLAAAGVPAEPDVFVVDIDSDDLGVLSSSLTTLRPRLVVVEYNGAFPPGASWAVGPHGDGWDGTFRHGASLTAFDNLLRPAGYRLVYCERKGVNAFFVRSDLCDGHFGAEGSVAERYRPPAFTAHPFGHPRSKAGVAPMGEIAIADLQRVTFRHARIEERFGSAGSNGELFRYSFVVDNGSPERLTSGEPNAFSLSTRWLDPANPGAVPPDAARTFLPVPVPPNSSRRIVLWAEVPADPYRRLRVTAVQEGVFWREDLGGTGAFVDLDPGPGGPLTSDTGDH